jgi:hypothetical protein
MTDKSFQIPYFVVAAGIGRRKQRHPQLLSLIDHLLVVPPPTTEFRLLLLSSSSDKSLLVQFIESASWL